MNRRTKEKRKAKGRTLRARPIPKMRRQRLFLGFSEEIVQFAIDAIHRLNQAIQGAIQRGLIKPFPFDAEARFSASIVFWLFCTRII